MGGFEEELPGTGGGVYKFPGSSCVSTQMYQVAAPRDLSTDLFLLWKTIFMKLKTIRKIIDCPMISIKILIFG